jgi:hypothetical protein
LFKNIINNSLEKYKPQITLVNLGIPNMSVADYSMMFYDAEFYSYIPSEMFLVFQTDSIILKENRDKIYEFMEYDYVGAPWKKSFGLLGAIVKKFCFWVFSILIISLLFEVLGTISIDGLDWVFRFTLIVDDENWIVKLL